MDPLLGLGNGWMKEPGGGRSGVSGKRKGKSRQKKTLFIFRDILSDHIDNGEFLNEGGEDRDTLIARYTGPDQLPPNWTDSTTDGTNFLHLLMKEPIEEDDDAQRSTALSHRITFAKWLLSRYPDLFTQSTTTQLPALSVVIEGYNAKNEHSCQVNREFANAFLREQTLRESCHSFLNGPDQTSHAGPQHEKTSKVKLAPNEGSYSMAHNAVKQMGVDILQHLHLIDDSTLKLRDDNGNTPLHVALDVKEWKLDESIEGRVDLIAELARRCKDALTMLNGIEGNKKLKRCSPYQYHQEQCNEHHAKQGPCKNKSCPNVEHILKEAYMRLPDHSLVIEHLYNGKQVIYSHLDLSELRDARKPPPNFLKTAERSIGHMNLETILRYIFLPKVPTLSEQSLDAEKDYINYTKVFHLLKEKKVKTIIKLRVEDNELLPHSNDAIVSAVKGINVDVWDWEQYNLCCDTIADAAPNVQKVFLYSNGNKAVLQNWTSADGLPKLKKLEKVIFVIKLRPLTGDIDFDYKKYLYSRGEQIGLKRNMIDVKVLKNLSATGIRESMQMNMNQETGNCGAWFKCINRFSEFITNMPPNIETKAGHPNVKIAIIDDGIDLYEPRFMDPCIMEGVSFHTRGEVSSSSSEESSTHHFPSYDGHGTEMAARVRQVFPKAQLYIARLNILSGSGGSGTTITARSAAEAINWAVTKNVDIISMSWTIGETDQNKQDIKAMENAIIAASNKNIMMFCAAKDDGIGSNIHFGYPQSFSQPVFCIGATTENGAMSDSVGSQKGEIHFGLPGVDITPLVSGETGKIVGSSIATALASGLAGLLLYIVHFDRTGDSEGSKSQRAKLQNHRMLKSVLKKMAPEQKFIRVQDYFEIGPDVDWGPGDENWGDGVEEAGGGGEVLYQIVETLRNLMKDPAPR